MADLQCRGAISVFRGSKSSAGTWAECSVDIAAALQLLSIKVKKKGCVLLPIPSIYVRPRRKHLANENVRDGECALKAFYINRAYDENGCFFVV